MDIRKIFGKKGEEGESVEGERKVTEESTEEEKEEKKEEKKEEEKGRRPRWPPRKQGVLPDVELSMKTRIRRAARYLMKQFGVEGGPQEERDLMNSIVKGMGREMVEDVLKPRKKLMLRSLGRGSFFCDGDLFYDSDPEVPFARSDTSYTATAHQFDVCSDTDSPSVDTPDEDTSEKAVGKEDDAKGPSDADDTDFTFAQISMATVVNRRTTQSTEKISEDSSEVGGRPIDEARVGEECTQSEGDLAFLPTDDGGEEMPHRAAHRRLHFSKDDDWSTDSGSSYNKRWKNAGEKRETENKPEGRTHIGRITLLTSGSSVREELGYMTGWTEYVEDELSAEGRKALEVAGKGILRRGMKFDTVVTSNKAVDRETTNLMLYSAGQDSMKRYTTWELNPRHLGDLEGCTREGVAAQWGWMSNEVWANLGPPKMDDLHPDWYRQAEGPRQTGETILHVQARTKRVWSYAKRLLRKGRRSVLLVAHKSVIAALLKHSLGLQPTDLSEWSPSAAVPLVLAYWRKGQDMGLAAVECLTKDSKAQSMGLYKAMLERYVDNGILDKYAFAELRDRLAKGKPLPTIEDIIRYKVEEAQRTFELRASKEGERELLLDTLTVFWGLSRKGTVERVYNRMEGKSQEGEE